MTGLFLPESAVRSLLSEQERYWNPILRQLDPKLRLVPPMPDPPVGMLPNRWHVYREGDRGGAPLYHAIQTPEGGFLEMSDAVIEHLRKHDLRSSRSERIRRENQQARERSEARAKQRLKEDRVESIAQRIANKERPSILFSPDVRFKNRAYARRDAA